MDIYIDLYIALNARKSLRSIVNKQTFNISVLQLQDFRVKSKIHHRHVFLAVVHRSWT